MDNIHHVVSHVHHRGQAQVQGQVLPGRFLGVFSPAGRCPAPQRGRAAAPLAAGTVYEDPGVPDLQQRTHLITMAHVCTCCRCTCWVADGAVRLDHGHTVNGTEAVLPHLHHLGLHHRTGPLHRVLWPSRNQAANIRRTSDGQTQDGLKVPAVPTQHPSPEWIHLRRYLLQVDVGTDQSVVEEEKFSLFGFDDLTFVIKNHLSQQLRVNRMFLL